MFEEEIEGSKALDAITAFDVTMINHTTQANQSSEDRIYSWLDGYVLFTAAHYRF